MDLMFQLALVYLCMGTLSRDDWQFFQSRVLSNLSQDEQLRFQDAVVLFSQNADVTERNMRTLDNAGTPVARVEARYCGSISQEEGSGIDSDYCNGLEHLLKISIGSRVSLP